MNKPRTMFDKIWDRAVVHEREDGKCLLFVDRHVCHDGVATGVQMLKARGLAIRRPELTLGSADHLVSTKGPTLADVEDEGMRQTIVEFGRYREEYGVELFTLGDPNRGIVHVVGPEQGFTQPGLLMVCGDSHTSTHGALGALAFGIGTTELSHVLATQCIWQSRPKTMRIEVQGIRPTGVSAKDVILAIIARIGTAGAVGHVIEYSGDVIRNMSVEERLTVCNMSIEAGARAGMIAPDETTIEYLRGRPHAPGAASWDKAVAFWRSLPSDLGARFDREVSLDGGAMAPMVTWGTSPQDASAVTGTVPDPSTETDPARRTEIEQALAYMGLHAGMPIDEIALDGIFIGSCTNSRIEDLRAAANVLRGHKVRVPGFVSPGSGLVKAQAEREGLDKIFLDAGLEWRESGCSMCVGMNGDIGKPGERWASTSNRNFVGRQGPGVRTHLVSPAMAAAAAVTGTFTDVRSFALNGPLN
jgi:3-isopropylmalate/(R)-2-methylmalate dehydratase large subunit